MCLTVTTHETTHLKHVVIGNYRELTRSTMSFNTLTSIIPFCKSSGYKKITPRMKRGVIANSQLVFSFREYFEYSALYLFSVVASSDVLPRSSNPAIASTSSNAACLPLLIASSACPSR